MKFDMSVKLNDLEAFSEKILSQLEQSGYEEIEIDIDRYWKLSFENIDIDKRNPKVTIGSFVEDWNNLKKLLDNDHPITADDMDRLGNVLKIIGDLVDVILID